jgi:peptide/nickel transport system permease protein
MKRPILWLAAALLSLVAVAVCAPHWLSAVDPLSTNPTAALLPPGAGHPFGTDQVGRDVWSRVVHGAATTVLAGLGATVAALLAGGLLGTLSALGPRIVRGLFLRGTEIALAIPEFLLALLLVALIGVGPVGIAIAVAVAAFPGYARVSALSAREAIGSPAVEAVRLVGVGGARVFFAHILPRVARPLFALATAGAAFAMLSVAGLTFLGLGVSPPSPDWGAMLSEGQGFFSRGWWVVVFPGLALVLTVASLTVFGRAARGANQ